MEVIAWEVRKVTGITQESLYGLSRSREGALGRSIVSYLERVVSGSMIKDVARHFRRSPMVMSQEMIEKLKTDLTQQAKKKYPITIA
jgi:chromosomal replication initiation ATPase DnaA